MTDKAEQLARVLFADDVFEGGDCRNEWGREGQPCRICADLAERWANRIEEVRKAIKKVQP